MTTLIIYTKRLKAAAEACKSKGLRTIDNNVCVDVASTGNVYIVGTDGLILYVGENETRTAPGAARTVVIPRDVVEMAVKAAGKSAHVTLDMSGGAARLGNIAFPPQTQYPNWRKVVGTVDAAAELGYQRLDTALITQADKILKTATGAKITRLRTFASDTPPEGEIQGTKPALFTVSGLADYVILGAMRPLKNERETFAHPKA